MGEEIICVASKKGLTHCTQFESITPKPVQDWQQQNMQAVTQLSMRQL